MKQAVGLACVVLLMMSCGLTPRPVTLRVISAQIGPRLMEYALQPIMERFEKDNPGVTITWDDSLGSSYQFKGLPAALAGNTPPDIYFEWAGNRVLQHVKRGEALDISDLANGLRGELLPAAWGGFAYNGRTYGLSYHVPVTMMIWYERALFARLGLAPPVSWADFESLCARLNARGIRPLQFGNADGWTAGNFGASFLYRVAGDARASSILSLEKGTRLDDPDFVTALGYLRTLALKGYVNPDLNSLGYEASAAAMFNGKAGLYPMGTWFMTELVPLYHRDPSSVDFAFFNLPPLPGGKGDQSSVIGVGDGLVINAKTPHPEAARKFLRHFFSRYSMELLAAEGLAVTRRDALDKETPSIREASRLLGAAGHVNSPPDTGYDLAVAAAVYKAIGRALEGADPAGALAEAESTIAGLRK
jgi:raffinose/stachyose/melibiose transport system substrate-binding protein